MKKFFKVLIVLSFFSRPGTAQQSQFSQYMFNGVNFNPAFAGYKERLNMHVFYRSPLTGTAGAPTHISVTYDDITEKGNAGVALQVMHNAVGPQIRSSFYLNYAYRFRLNQAGTSMIALGAALGSMVLKANPGQLNPADYPAGTLFYAQDVNLFDVKLGAYYFKKNFYAGISADNLFTRFVDPATLPFLSEPKVRYFITAGTAFSLAGKLACRPSFLWRDDRASAANLDLSALVGIADKFWVGGTYRKTVKRYNNKNIYEADAVATVVHVFPVARLRVGYSSDFGIGNLNPLKNNLHELSLALTFRKKQDRGLTGVFEKQPLRWTGKSISSRTLTTKLRFNQILPGQDAERYNSVR